ncbi:MAG: DUF1624 domain-containing protein [Chitinophagales bacterium]|nr:DUF1624 domain-containing protein [Chitinophagales bacterium]
MKRVHSIDFLRGLVMVIMALDHTRDLLHLTAQTQDPTNLSNTTTALFLTRWITHLCAPTFVFLSGASAYLSLKNHGDFAASRRFLFKRGFWLVLLNFTLVNFGIFLDVHFSVLFLQVIAAIGFGFIGLALLLKLSARTLGIIGLVLIFGHNLFSGVSFPQGTPLNVLWSVLMGANFYQISPKFAFLTTYPIIPWLGIMLAGFGFGELLGSPARKTLFWRIALGALALFVLLRTFNVYGDPAHWAVQKDGWFTALSFINVSKYPPSLLFTLLMLGIAFLILYAFEGVQNRFTKVVEVYGKVPLFYYVLHWYVIHAVAALVFLAQGYSWSDLQFSGMGFGRPQAGGGLDLAGTYLVWLGVVALLYPCCRWYGRYKMAHPENWVLRYW